MEINTTGNGENGFIVIMAQVHVEWSTVFT